jgi:hypothetical protein
MFGAHLEFRIVTKAADAIKVVVDLQTFRRLTGKVSAFLPLSRRLASRQTVRAVELSRRGY